MTEKHPVITYGVDEKGDIHSCITEVEHESILKRQVLKAKQELLTDLLLINRDYIFAHIMDLKETFHAELRRLDEKTE